MTLVFVSPVHQLHKHTPKDSIQTSLHKCTWSPLLQFFFPILAPLAIIKELNEPMTSLPSTEDLNDQGQETVGRGRPVQG